MTSIKDVAKLAGVSTATISRTLSDPELVSEKTRKKVREAIRESGYVANSLARSFRTKKSDTVLVLVPDISNPFYSTIIQGIESVARDNGYRVILGDTQQDQERERSYAGMVQQRQADGIILLGSSIPFETPAELTRAEPSWPPLVMACEYLDVGLPTVRIDNVAAAEDAVSHLVRLGHKKIAFINGPEHSPLSVDRHKGYRQAIETAGIIYDEALTVAGDYSLESGVAATKSLLAGSSQPTALFAANDEMAIGALKEIKAAGLQVPGDVSVVGFDDIQFADFCDPPLTTVHQPRTEIGRSVMELMLAILSGERPSEDEIVLGHNLVVRGSTAEPKSTDSV